MKRTTRPLIIKSLNDEQGIFEGYGSVFNFKDYHGDNIQPGAFSKNLAEWKEKGQFPALLWQHRMSDPIGVYEEMREDKKGLFVRGRLLIDEVTQAKEAWALLKAGALGGLSVGYKTIKEEYDGEASQNLIKEVGLWETSLVTSPANEEARVENLKSTDITTTRDFEEFLRDAGYSRKEAKRIALHGFSQRDADSEREIEQLVKNLKMMEVSQ